MIEAQPVFGDTLNGCRPSWLAALSNLPGSDVIGMDDVSRLRQDARGFAPSTRLEAPDLED